MPFVLPALSTYIINHHVEPYTYILSVRGHFSGGYATYLLIGYNVDTIRNDIIDLTNNPHELITINIDSNNTTYRITNKLSGYDLLCSITCLLGDTPPNIEPV